MYVFKAEELSLLAAVRKAIKDNRFAVNLPSKSNCVRMRAQFYAFAKKIRKIAESDVILLEVVGELDQVTMSIEENVLVVQRKDATPAIVALNKALEQAKVEIRDPNMEAYRESEKKLMEKLKPEDTPGEGAPRVTPYYTRDK
jgi:hypothetical protein